MISYMFKCHNQVLETFDEINATVTLLQFILLRIDASLRSVKESNRLREQSIRLDCESDASDNTMYCSSLISFLGRPAILNGDKLLDMTPMDTMNRILSDLLDPVQRCVRGSLERVSSLGKLSEGNELQLQLLDGNLLRLEEVLDRLMKQLQTSFSP